MSRSREERKWVPCNPCRGTGKGDQYDSRTDTWTKVNCTACAGARGWWV